jgi:hypothetical protein
MSDCVGKPGARHYDGNAAIVADLSNDPTYAGPLLENFGPRVISLQIGRYGDGMTFERRPVAVGRNYLLELLRSEKQSDQVRFVEGPASRCAFEQLANLETELRESGTVYTCPPGQHDVSVGSHASTNMTSTSRRSPSGVLRLALIRPSIALRTWFLIGEMSMASTFKRFVH